MYIVLFVIEPMFLVLLKSYADKKKSGNQMSLFVVYKKVLLNI